MVTDSLMYQVSSQPERYPKDAHPFQEVGEPHSTEGYPHQYSEDAARPQSPQRQILNENTVSRIVRIPKRIIREEIVEEEREIRETVIEIAKPVKTEKIVHVPEIEYRDKIKEVVEHVVKEKIKEVPLIEYCERIIEDPKIIRQEKIVVVPQIEYRDVITERVVCIPEIHQNVTVKEVEVPTYVDKEGEVIEPPVMEIGRKIPVPVEAVTVFEYQLAQLRPRVTKVQYPIYVPRFIPVPVPSETIESSRLQQMQDVVASVSKLVSPQAVDLHDLEALEHQVRSTDFTSKLPTTEEAQNVIREKWLTGQLQVNATEPTESKYA